MTYGTQPIDHVCRHETLLADAIQELAEEMRDD